MSRIRSEYLQYSSHSSPARSRELHSSLLEWGSDAASCQIIFEACSLFTYFNTIISRLANDVDRKMYFELRLSE